MRILAGATTLALAFASCATTHAGGDSAEAGKKNEERVCQTYKVTGSRLPQTVCRPEK